MKVLLALLLVTAATTRAFQCPSATEISPCVCSTHTVNAQVHGNLDCSKIQSNAALKKVFQANFLSTKFSNLTISHKTSHPALTELEPYVFGDVSFQHILIENTHIRNINEEALAPSHEALISLILTKNEINTFPFEALPAFLHLRFLSLANNKLSSLPNLESNSLLYIDLSSNTGLSFTDDTFRATPEVEQLHLHEMGLVSLPPNVFSSLNRLKILDLSKNVLKGELGQGVIRVPIDSLEDLRLNNNKISNIDASAITGVHRTAKIDFQNNNIQTLEWEKWYPLLDQLSSAQAVDLRGNQLTCSCDVVWLLQDEDELSKIHDKTICSNGILLKNTDVDSLLVTC